MRIAYFIPGALTAGPLGGGEMERRAEYLRAFVGPAHEVDVLDTDEGPPSIESAAEEELAVGALLAGVPEVERRYDAMIVGCYGDPGLAALREVADVPVVGPGQASLHLALQLGERFGVLAVVDQVVPANRRQVRGYGLEHLLVDVRPVDIPVLELRSRGPETKEALTRAGAELVRDGADVLVLGCMSMGFLDVATELQVELGVPVINPVLAALKAAETMLDLGVGPSRRCYPRPRKEVAVGVLQG